jgi:uncharacterized protein (TIGR03067 family)
LEGAWEFVGMEVDGAALPAPAMAASRLLIAGDRFRMESPEADYDGIFTIDVESVPYQIDIQFVAGPEAGNWSYGIFEQDGDDLKICLGLTGAARPQSFATAAGSGHALENLRRVARGRPRTAGQGTPAKAPSSQGPVNVDTSMFEMEMTPLLERLQGEWIPLQLIQNGQALAETMLAYGSRFFAGNETKVVFGGQTMLHAKMRLDESHVPAAVDYLHLARPFPGRVSLGIMEWAGGDVRICMAAPGQPRPTDFTCMAGSGRTLSVWRRK